MDTVLPKALEIAERLEKPDKPRDIKTRLKESRVLKEYLTNGYSATQAVKDVYGRTSSGVASSMATEIMSRPSVQSKLLAILKEYDADITEQVGVLGQIAKGSYIRTITTETTDTKGNVITKVVKEEPGPRDIATAINLLAKLTGTYDAMKIKSTIATKEAKRLYDSIDHDIAKARKAGAGSIADKYDDAIAEEAADSMDLSGVASGEATGEGPGGEGGRVSI